jgi:hypothetical protein
MRSFKKKHYFIPTKTHEILSCADITGRSSGKKTYINDCEHLPMGTRQAMPMNETRVM